MLPKTRIYLFGVFVLFLASCGGKKIRDFGEYSQWLNEPENGVVKSRTVLGIKYTLKYLPVDYMVYKDVSGRGSKTKAEIDSIRKQYEHSLTFVLNINPIDQQGGSIMSRDIRNFEQYKMRSAEMNFGMQNWITLEFGDESISPVFAELENTYDLTKDRNIYIVFNKSQQEILENTSEIDLVFDDQLFSTGITHYKFKAYQLENIPELVMNTDSKN